jgi:hypothetical protein
MKNDDNLCRVSALAVSVLSVLKIEIETPIMGLPLSSKMFCYVDGVSGENQ